jgi:hypothetical protein
LGRRQPFWLRSGVVEAASGVDEVPQDGLGKVEAGRQPAGVEVHLVEIQQTFGQGGMVVEAAGVTGLTESIRPHDLAFRPKAAKEKVRQVLGQGEVLRATEGGGSATPGAQRQAVPGGDDLVIERRSHAP